MTRRDWSSPAAFAAYTALSLLYFGLRLLIEPGHQYIGPLDDPQIVIWAFAWLPHAILHGAEPAGHARDLVAGGRQPHVVDDRSGRSRCSWRR